MPNHKKRKNFQTSASVHEEMEDTEVDTVNRVDTSVYFHARVTQANINKLIVLIGEASNEASRYGSPYVWLYIHSPGGDAFAGFSAMDHISTNWVPIITVADGLVASAATFMLLGGVRRFAMPHCHILIHQVQTEFSGKYKDLLDDVSNTKSLMKTMKEIYKNTTLLRGKLLKQMLYTELYITTQQAIKHGIVENVYSAYIV